MIPIQEWQPDHWENLEGLCITLRDLLDKPMRENRAWRVKLTLTLKAIADYTKDAY